MPKIPTRWLARTVKLNGVLPIAALCLICKAEGQSYGSDLAVKAVEQAALFDEEKETATAGDWHHCSHLY